jgi:hypothetical protein
MSSGPGAFCRPQARFPTVYPQMNRSGGCAASASVTITAVTDLPAPRAARLRRPSWRDSRLLIGLVLVLASVALGARAIAVAEGASPVYAATTTLPAGHQLVAADLRVVQVRLGGDAAPYLNPAATLDPGAVVLRTVGVGELVPLSAVGAAAALDRRPVAIPVAAPVPGDITVGAAVDVWSAPRLTGAAANTFGSAATVVTGAEVYSVTTDSGSLGVTRTASVQVLVTQAQLPLVLNALANNAKVTLVPRPGSAPGAAG